MTQNYIGTKQITAWVEERDGQPGYGVLYQDGYRSWSPKDVFEQAYLPMGHVGHLPDFVQRLVGEKVQLDDRINKLDTFLSNNGADKLGDIPHRLMVSQSAVMKELSDILEARLELLDHNKQHEPALVTIDEVPSLPTS